MNERVIQEAFSRFYGDRAQAHNVVVWGRVVESVTAALITEWETYGQECRKRGKDDDAAACAWAAGILGEFIR